MPQALRGSALLSALIDPSPDHSNLFTCQRLCGRAASASWPARPSGVGGCALWRRPSWSTEAAGPTRSCWTAATRPAWPTWPAGTSFRRHRRLVVDLRSGNDQVAFLAVACRDDFAMLAAFEKCLEAVQTKSTFLLFFAVAPDAGGFKHWPNVFGVGQALFVRCWWDLAEIDSAKVEFFGPEARRSDGQKTNQKDAGNCRGHVFVGLRCSFDAIDMSQNTCAETGAVPPIFLRLLRTLKSCRDPSRITRTVIVDCRIDTQKRLRERNSMHPLSGLAAGGRDCFLPAGAGWQNITLHVYEANPHPV